MCSMFLWAHVHPRHMGMSSLFLTASQVENNCLWLIWKSNEGSLFSVWGGRPLSFQKVSYASISCHRVKCNCMLFACPCFEPHCSFEMLLQRMGSWHLRAGSLPVSNELWGRDCTPWGGVKQKKACAFHVWGARAELGGASLKREHFLVSWTHYTIKPHLKHILSLKEFCTLQFTPQSSKSQQPLTDYSTQNSLRKIMCFKGMVCIQPVNGLSKSGFLCALKYWGFFCGQLSWRS